MTKTDELNNGEKSASADNGPVGGSAEQRQHTRVQLEVDVNLETENNFYAGITNDISEGGVFVATYTPPPKGTVIEMELKLPSLGAVRVKGSVQWIRTVEAAGSDSPPGCGIRFQDLDGTVAKAISDFCTKRDSIYYDED